MLMLILSNSNSRSLAEKISSFGNIPRVRASLKKFPDGENYVRIDSDLKGRDILLLASMFPDQNGSLVEFLLLADACRDFGAKKIIAAIPYFAYSRQEKRHMDGEALSLKTIASLLKAVGIEKIITVDAHFHRIPEAFDFFGIPAAGVSAGKMLLEHIKKNICGDFIVIGPDATSAETVQFAAGKKAAFKKTKICPECKKPAAECKCEGEKKEYEIREMKSDIALDFRDKNVVILDDMIASGSTMIAAVEKAKREGAKKVIAAAIHGLFLSNSLEILQKKADYLVVADTIETPVSAVSVAGLIAEGIKS